MRWCDPDEEDEEWIDSGVEPMAWTGINVDVTENPVVAELLGPDGDVIRQWRERPPFGFTR